MGVGAKVGFSGSASAKKKAALVLSALVFLIAAAAAPSSASAVAPRTLWKGCTTGSGAGHCQFPVGIAADPTTGNLYVADPGNNRVVELTAWGQFVRAWGWGVKDGAAEPEICTAQSGCQAGLRGGGGGEFNGPTGVAVDSGGNVYVADAERVEKFDSEGHFLVTWGGGVVSGGAAGSGDLTAGSTKVVNLVTTSKSFEAGQAITGAGIASGTIVTDHGVGTLTLSKPATASGSGVALSVAEGAGNAPANERQTVTIGGPPSGGSFSLILTAAHFHGQIEPGSNQLTGTKGLIGAVHVGDEAVGMWSATGRGNLTVGSTTVTGFSTSGGTFSVGKPVHVGFGLNKGIPAGTTIVAVGGGTLTLSRPATKTSEGVDIDAGATVAAIDTATGTLTLSATRAQESPGSATETTAPIPYNATASEVAEKLEALADIGPGNVAVSGAAGGPWTIEFKGPLLADTNVEQLEADGSTLTPSGTATVATAIQGAGAPEACTVVADCRAGLFGAADNLQAGQFGQWKFGSFIAAGSANTIYVGDEGRVQEFEANGAFVKSIPVPGETVLSLAVDSSGSMYMTFFKSFQFGEESKEGVEKLSPAGALECTAKAKDPLALATDAAGNLYVVDGVKTLFSEAQIRKFTSACAEVKDSEFPFADSFDSSLGIATNTVTKAGEVGLYVSNRGQENSFVRAYYPPPDKWPPPSAPPSIAAQYATTVSTDSATLRAKVNPHFWTDTRYYLEYGTGKCSEGGCEAQPMPPGSKLGAGVVDEDVTTQSVVLSGLQPDATYHYRFVAKSSGGGPVRGLGGEVGHDGAEGIFTTFPAAGEGSASCPNAALRAGAAARLPDCRAYEMVSPVEKEGGDAAVLESITINGFGGGYLLARLDQSTPDGEKVAYSTTRAFADAESAPWSSQHIATRDPATGWSSESIDAPRSNFPLNSGAGNDVAYKLFSEDLCSGWVFQDTDRTLVEGAPEGVPNIYRRRICDGGYELLTSVPPPGFSKAEAPNSKYIPEIQAETANGAHSFFRADARLTANALATPGVFQLYESSEGAEADRADLRLVSVLPDGLATPTHASLGTAASQYDDFRDDSVQGAVSGDGSRVFWTAGEGSSPPFNGGQNFQPGTLYLRANPLALESAHLHGTAAGTGDLSGPVQCTGHTTVSSKTISEVACEGGASFVVGQAISGPGVPAGATVTTVGATSIKISLAANATGSAQLSGPGSELVANVATSTGAFAVGQEVSAAGIPPGTTIVAVNEAEHKLTLSAKATATGVGVALSATSACTEAAKACTIQVSGSNSEFWSADPSGSTAIYQTGDKLYEARIEAQGESLVSHSTPIAEGVEGVAGTSEDASRVYFVSNGVLNPGEENGEGGEAVDGRPNVYLHSQGGGNRFIAALAAKIDASPSIPSIDRIKAGLRLSRVSADGSEVVFDSTAPLTGYDNSDASSGEPDGEVYLYQATANEGEGELLCLSCNPSGSRPHGRDLGTFNNNEPDVWAAAQIPGWMTQNHPSRLLSASGERIFFESFDALVPTDTNGAKDVYEWEQAEGRDRCEEMGAQLYVASAGGCLSLISSGESPQDSEFIDASADGRDVFFTTNASLLPQDPGLVDLYDARVEGGFAQPGPPAQCEGEACQSPPEAPNDQTPASSSFEGAGNVTEEPGSQAPKPCAKGKVKRHGKCVAKKHAKHSHKRASHKRRAKR